MGKVVPVPGRDGNETGPGPKMAGPAHVYLYRIILPDEQENAKYILYDPVNVLHELFPYSKQVFAMVLQILPTIDDPKLNLNEI